jgi:hypothetical protein
VLVPKRHLESAEKVAEMNNLIAEALLVYSNGGPNGVAKKKSPGPALLDRSAVVAVVAA